MSDEGLEAAADSLYHDNMALLDKLEEVEDENSRFKMAISALEEALRDDIENNVKWLNTEARERFHKSYPNTAESLRDCFKALHAAENRND